MSFARVLIGLRRVVQLKKLIRATGMAAGQAPSAAIPHPKNEGSGECCEHSPEPHHPILTKGVTMPRKNNTTRGPKTKKANADVSTELSAAYSQNLAQNGLRVLELPRDYPALSFRCGKEIAVSPANPNTLTDPANLIVVRFGADVLIGHPYAIDEGRFALAQPITIYQLSEVEVLGELAAI